MIQMKQDIILRNSKTISDFLKSNFDTLLECQCVNLFSYRKDILSLAQNEAMRPGESNKSSSVV